MIIFGILCTIIGITRIFNTFLSDDSIYESQLKKLNEKSYINITPNTIRILLIIIGVIETFCGLFVWFNV